jgi:2-polyprenyl-3-methyl-5-hydroxy-6-metoxy-1,4-benzoquinol methylase
MRIEESVIPYLKDEKFSNGLYLKTSVPKKTLDNRIDYLCEYASGKKIIHVGCVDHIPLIQKKIENKVWLHSRIDEVASRQLGIDINREGLEYLKSKMGIQNAIYEDIISDSEVAAEIRSEKWDAMILGEILEHVDNPVLFLKNLKKKYSPYINYLVISVPNAFAWENFYWSLKKMECINTDHRAWFSVYTLAKNLTLAEFEIDFHDYVTSYPNDYKGSWKKRFLKKYPQLNSTIIMGAKF